MSTSQLALTARTLVAASKGLLAADESTGTIGKRFDAVGIENTAAHRRSYRQMLFTTKDVAQYISGVILYDETLRQQADDGTPLVDLIGRQGMIPGIKVDTGAKPLAGSPGELVTEGLDGLRDRLVEYRTLGARFAKWRAVIRIGPGLPTAACIEANAAALARYAGLCQENGLVPIVEPEVLMDGDHTIERCFEVTEAVQHAVFAILYRHHVTFEEMLLKPNMILAGSTCPRQPEIREVAEATLRCLRRTVPAAMPGIVFLSGGQDEQAASAHLNAINALPGPHPWPLSFSYGRALQATALAAWRGDPQRMEAAQRAFSHRARCNSAAAAGRYSPELGPAPSEPAGRGRP
jgi:fructose-bisphosphate aldolase, class I